MKIKTKLLIGFGLLFIVVVFFGAVSVYYIKIISDYSNITLKDNYETLTFTRDMRSVLDENDLPLSTKAADKFNAALKNQEHNITEPGEKEATTAVRAGFGQLTDASISLDKKQQAERSIRLKLQAIDGLNMNAIVQKNNYIHETVSTATLRLSGIVFVTFLILFIFIINFPGFILKPLHAFIDGVNEVGQKNYDVKIELDSGDEFASLAQGFNNMAANLRKLEDDDLTKILSGENQVKILIAAMPEAVIGINEKQEILFMNSPAKKILNIEDKMVNGRKIADAVNNEGLVKTLLESKKGESTLQFALDGKTQNFQVKSFEIVLPNVRPEPFNSVLFSGFPGGMVYILKKDEHKKHEAVKSN